MTEQQLSNTMQVGVAKVYPPVYFAIHWRSGNVWLASMIASAHRTAVSTFLI